MCNGIQSTEDQSLGATSGDAALKNNYVRPEGQNVGNFITDRPSSRVLAPPGGGTSISLG
jgi:SPIRAL1-like protein